MRTETLQTIAYWLVAALIYPGVLFGAALALLGEATLAGFRPLLIPRPFRGPRRHRSRLQPFYNFLKLSGRTPATHIPYSDSPERSRTETAQAILGGICAIAPLLAIALMPFPGNLLHTPLGLTGDLLVVVLLLSVQPIVANIEAPGASNNIVNTSSGRFGVGLLPVLLGLAALIEVQGSSTANIAAIEAAPETGIQALVRLLVGAALLIALPWWCERSDTLRQTSGGYAGMYLQRAALAAFWSISVLPVPGEPGWAVLTTVGGALFAYVAMWIIEERSARGVRARDAARLIWVGAVPAAALAMLAALWQGAL